MTPAGPPTLRYFAARGRAQFLRYYFLNRDIEFIDEQVAMTPDFAAWAPIRGDRALSGPFHKLPVLHYDGTPINANFIANEISQSLKALNVTPLKAANPKKLR